MSKFIPITLIALLACCGLRSEPALRQQFTGNKSMLVQILEMQKEDSRIVRIAPSFTRLDNDWSWPRKDIGFTEKRWNEYRALFRKARISDGIQKDDGFVFFFVSSQGLAIAGTSRGFVFTKRNPSPVVRSFDDCPREEGLCYIALEEHWYLFQWVT